MTRAAIMWSNGQSQLVAPLKENEPNVIGRASDSDVVIEEPTVSRRHAMVRMEGDVFVLENVSQSNIAQLNDVTIERPVPLSDKDSLRLGNVRLAFHDLKAGDRISGPICSHCSRENMASDKDCWYCGTSLVNAPTSILTARKAACRLVARSGETFDVHPGETFVGTPGGDFQVARDEDLPASISVAVRPADAKAGAYLLAAAEGTLVNGRPPEPRRPLKTGDQVEAEGKAFVILVR